MGDFVMYLFVGAFLLLPIGFLVALTLSGLSLILYAVMAPFVFIAGMFTSSED